MPLKMHSLFLFTSGWQSDTLVNQLLIPGVTVGKKSSPGRIIAPHFPRQMNMKISSVIVSSTFLCASLLSLSNSNAQSRSTGIESHPGASPTTGSGSAGQRRGTSAGDNPAAMMQRHLDQNARDQDAQARQRDAEELKRLQEENARLRDAERQQQQQQRNSGAAAGRTSGAGGASGSQGDDPDGGTGGSTTMANSPFQKPNPDANHEGKGCAYFTKPAVTDDGSTLNYYGEGAFVVYGKWMYKCENKRWSNKGPASMWPKSEVDRLTAEKLESSSLRSGAYFSKD